MSTLSITNTPATFLLITFLLFVVGTVFVVGWTSGYERQHMFVVVRRLYTFWTIVFPACVFGVAVVQWLLRAHFESRRGFWWSFGANLGIAAACVLARVYATHIEPNQLLLREVEIRSSKVTAPVRLLHISDIQSGGVGAHEHRAIALAKSLDADIIIHTGDILQPRAHTSMEAELPRMAALLDTLDPPLGFYNVMGDVDWRLEDEIGGLFATMQTLRDEEAVIETGRGTLRLYGLTLGQSRDPGDARRVLERWPATGADSFTILLGHAPDFALASQHHHIDLCLAGHTHGGQVRLPFFGPPVTLSAVPRAWARGFREIGRTRLNVSAGIGAEHAADLPSIRVNCPPEMTLITILPADSEP